MDNLRPNEESASAPLDLSSDTFQWDAGLYATNTVAGLKRDIIRHIVSSLGLDYARPSEYNYYHGLALAVRDRMIDQWIKTQRSYYDKESKRVYYLSMEYLPGQSLLNNLHCLGMDDLAHQALAEFGLALEDVAEVEWDAGLGNGGLGRLASCYMDSMATLGPIRLRVRHPLRLRHVPPDDRKRLSGGAVRTTGRSGATPGKSATAAAICTRSISSVASDAWTDDEGRMRYRWVDTERSWPWPAISSCPGFGNGHVTNMRLWAAQSTGNSTWTCSTRRLHRRGASQGPGRKHLQGALSQRRNGFRGKELRLKQQYFFVAATLEDILRRFKKKHDSFDNLPDFVAIQLNDTHPAIAIPELMRLLVDEEGLGLGCGLGHLRADLRLHQPHRAARSPGNLVRAISSSACCPGTCRSSMKSTTASWNG